MEYITHRRFKRNAICGEVNLPFGTLCEERDGVIFRGELPLCFSGSENAHQYFSRDDDGNGVERGKLTQAIQKNLAKRDSGYQARWDKVWDDRVCQKYKRTDSEDFWLWGHAFFNADISDLRYIANLVGVTN